MPLGGHLAEGQAGEEAERQRLGPLRLQQQRTRRLQREILVFDGSDNS